MGWNSAQHFDHPTLETEFAMAVARIEWLAIYEEVCDALSDLI